MTGYRAAQAIPARRVTLAGSAVLAPRRPGGGWLWERAFPGAADQVRQVRAVVRSLLDGCDAQESVVHLLSELSANAVVFSLLYFRVAIAAVGEQADLRPALFDYLLLAAACCGTL